MHEMIAHTAQSEGPLVAGPGPHDSKLVPQTERREVKGKIEPEAILEYSPSLAPPERHDQSRATVIVNT